MQLQVRFRPADVTVRARSGSRLIDAVRRAGLPLASGCGETGLCGRCAVRVLAGGESLANETTAEQRTKSRNRIDPGLRLACRTIVTGDLEVTTSYW